MRRELGRPLAYVGLAAAAIFATGSIATVFIVNQQRSAAVETAQPSFELQQRADSALETITTWEATYLADQCTATAEVVEAVGLEQRAEVAIARATAVTDARLVLRVDDRNSFEQARLLAAEVFSAGIMTTKHEALASEYAETDDAVAACFERGEVGATAIPASELTEDSVAALEAQAAALDRDAIDTARIDEVREAVSELAAPTLAAAAAIVGASGIQETAAQLAERVEQLRSDPSPALTLTTLEALTIHAEAANARQAEIDAEAVQQVPARPVEPAPNPAPLPAPLPAPEPEPEPTLPGGGGEVGGTVEPVIP